MIILSCRVPSQYEFNYLFVWNPFLSTPSQNSSFSHSCRRSLQYQTRLNRQVIISAIFWSSLYLMSSNYAFSPDFSKKCRFEGSRLVGLGISKFITTESFFWIWNVKNSLLLLSGSPSPICFPGCWLPV